MEVALYVRVSTRRQAQTQTIDQQLDRLHAQLATHPEWHLAPEHIYRDDGYSGAHLHRPGLDRLRDHAKLARFRRVLLTAPDRLARSFVHQVLLIEELTTHGCTVEFLDRPMSDDPHDQLLLQIRGAVAEYERNLIADRMRRGRQTKLRQGLLLPWSIPPYGYIVDPDRPRDAHAIQLHPTQAVVVQQIFAWYTDLAQPHTLYQVTKRLNTEGIPPPRGCRWHASTVRNLLRNPAYIGTTYSGREISVPTESRRSALEPLGGGMTKRQTPPEAWIPIAVPAMVNPDTFAAAQEQMRHNQRTAQRHNCSYEYLLRGLVSCGRCRLSATGRPVQGGRYVYYICRGRGDALRADKEGRCTARQVRADRLDAVVWADLCQILQDPTLIIYELTRAQAGEWLPQELAARRQQLHTQVAQIERQQAQLLDVYLAEVIGREEFVRKRQELSQLHTALRGQVQELDRAAQQHLDTTAVAQGIEAFCGKIRPTLEELSFAQRRQLVELLIDHVVVEDGKVEIRYVIPTGPKGEATRFCHLRTDYFNRLASVITTKPLPQIRTRRGWIVLTTHQHAVLEPLRGVKAFQCHRHRIRAVVHPVVGPAQQRGVLAHARPCQLRSDALEQGSGGTMAGFSFDRVAQLQGQRQGFATTEARIHAQPPARKRALADIWASQFGVALAQGGQPRLQLPDVGLPRPLPLQPPHILGEQPRGPLFPSGELLLGLRQGPKRFLLLGRDRIVAQAGEATTPVLLGGMHRFAPSGDAPQFAGQAGRVAGRGIELGLLGGHPGGEQFGATTRVMAQTCFGGVQQVVQARRRDGIAGMVRPRQPQATVLRGLQADRGELIAQADRPVHVAEGRSGIGVAGGTDRATGEIDIQLDRKRLGVQRSEGAVQEGRG